MAALWRIFSAPVKVGVEVWTEPGKSLIDYLIKFQRLTLSVGVALSQVGGGGRAGNSGGTREPSSQKEFGFAEFFFSLRYLQS